jgi:hypothetical protein
MCEIHSFWQQELLQNSSQFRSGDEVKIALEKGAILPDDYPITIPLSATGTATFANLATIKNKVAKITRVRIFNK